LTPLCSQNHYTTITFAWQLACCDPVRATPEGKFVVSFHIADLPERLKLLECYAKLAEDFEEKGRAYLLAAMEGNRDCSAIGMVPTLVAAGLSRALNCEPRLEIPR
jgi:hypothetical protein